MSGRLFETPVSTRSESAGHRSGSTRVPTASLERVEMNDKTRPGVGRRGREPLTPCASSDRRLAADVSRRQWVPGGPGFECTGRQPALVDR
jgi:hypothetical protein